MKCPYCGGELRFWKMYLGSAIWKCDDCDREVEF